MHKDAFLAEQRLPSVSRPTPYPIKRNILTMQIKNTQHTPTHAELKESLRSFIHEVAVVVLKAPVSVNRLC